MRQINVTRDEAEMLVDLCEATVDQRLHIFAEELRELFGMSKWDGTVPDLSSLGIKNK